MPLTLSESWVHEGLPPYRVFQIRNRLEYLQSKGRDLQQHDFTVLELRERGDRFRCVTRMRMDIDIPAWLRRIIRPRMTLVQYELWRPPEPDGSRRQDIVVEVVGAPLTIEGYGMLRPMEWAGSHYSIRLDITSYRKVIGPRVERVALEQTLERVLGERDFAIRWMEGLAPARMR